jgi:hypothetical protein
MFPWVVDKSEPCPNVVCIAIGNEWIIICPMGICPIKKNYQSTTDDIR